MVKMHGPNPTLLCCNPSKGVSGKSSACHSVSIDLVSTADGGLAVRVSSVCDLLTYWPFVAKMFLNKSLDYVVVKKKKNQ